MSSMIPSLYTVQAGIGHGRDHFGGKDDSCVSNLTIYIQIFIFNFFYLIVIINQPSHMMQLHKEFELIISSFSMCDQHIFFAVKKTDIVSDFIVQYLKIFPSGLK